MTKILSIRFGNHVPKLKVGKQNLEVFRSSDGAHLISSKTVNKALGYDGKNKNWPFEFLMHLNQLTPVDPVLLESLSRQLVANNDGQLVPVILAPDLISLCKAISKANLNGYLFVSEQKFAKSAAEILKDMASIDIKKAIDFITGYDRFKLNHKSTDIKEDAGGD